MLAGPALIHLFALERNPTTWNEVLAVHPCKCRTGPCLRGPGTRKSGQRIPPSPTLDWSVCPYGLLRSPFANACRSVHRIASISPVSGWPERYPTWLVRGVLALRGV